MAHSLNYPCGHARTEENTSRSLKCGRPRTCCRTCRNAWRPDRRSHAENAAARYAEYVWARETGLTFDGTARMFGVQPASLERWLQRNGLEQA